MTSTWLKCLTFFPAHQPNWRGFQQPGNQDFVKQRREGQRWRRLRVHNIGFGPYPYGKRRRRTQTHWKMVACGWIGHDHNIPGRKQGQHGSKWIVGMSNLVEKKKYAHGLEKFFAHLPISGSVRFSTEQYDLVSCLLRKTDAFRFLPTYKTMQNSYTKSLLSPAPPIINIYNVSKRPFSYIQHGHSPDRNLLSSDEKNSTRVLLPTEWGGMNFETLLVFNELYESNGD